MHASGQSHASDREEAKRQAGVARKDIRRRDAEAWHWQACWRWQAGMPVCPSPSSTPISQHAMEGQEAAWPSARERRVPRPPMSSFLSLLFFIFSSFLSNSTEQA